MQAFGLVHCQVLGQALAAASKTVAAKMHFVLLSVCIDEQFKLRRENHRLVLRKAEASRMQSAGHLHDQERQFSATYPGVFLKHADTFCIRVPYR